VTLIAVVGDAATTTTAAIAAGWPTGAGGEVLVLEADPGGGALTGWLDVPAQPSLATIVANAGADPERSRRSVYDIVTAHARRSESGLYFVPNAILAKAADRAVEEAATIVIPALAASPNVVLADAGGHRAGRRLSPALRSAAVVVVVHRQAAASAAAASVRIDRLVETVEALAQIEASLVLAVIGRSPFDPEEIGAFVDRAVPDTVHLTAAIADDPLAAATLAGRVGVSAKRLRRLPLMRDAAELAGTLSLLAAESEGAFA
jgi:MinD-like ATPase involved in chromosome partitioning or flagellar assembly